MRDAKLGSGAVQVGGNGSGGVIIGKPNTGSGAIQVGGGNNSGGVSIGKPGTGSGSVQVGNGSGAITLPDDNSQQQAGGVFTRSEQSVQAFFAKYGARLP